MKLKHLSCGITLLTIILLSGCDVMGKDKETPPPTEKTTTPTPETKPEPSGEPQAVETEKKQEGTAEDTSVTSTQTPQKDAEEAHEETQSGQSDTQTDSSTQSPADTSEQIQTGTPSPSVEAAPPPPPPKPTTPPPSAITHKTQVVTTSGETISINVTKEGFHCVGYEGKPLVLEFFGDTCPHCINAIPMYNNLQSKYGDRVLILTINDGAQYTTLDNTGLKRFVSNHGIKYRTVSREKAGNLKAYAKELVGSMPGVPYVIIVNKEGVITDRMFVPSASQLEASILDVLQ